MKSKRNFVPLAELLDALAPIVRPAMLEQFRPDCCVDTCIVLRRVFRTFGFDSHPLAVTVQVFNKNMLRLLQDRVVLPADRQDRIEFCEREGAWGIGIGTGDGLRSSQGLFNGHLVLRMNRMLVDASLQQVERIDRGIVLGSFLAKEARQDFFDGKDRPMSVFDVNGCAVTYRRILDDSYHHNEHWTSPSPLHSRVSKKIIEQAQAELGLMIS